MYLLYESFDYCKKAIISIQNWRTQGKFKIDAPFFNIMKIYFRMISLQTFDVVSTLKRRRVSTGIVLMSHRFKKNVT